jgi:hypothetical protein
VNDMNTPETHPDPWVDLIRDYVTEAVCALTHQGFQVKRSWLDPRDPRDATILYTSSLVEPRALVWDEETGWREGRLRDGRPGVRTTLSEVTYLGGGPLVSTDEFVRRMLDGTRNDRAVYRSHSDVRDGFDDTLRDHRWLTPR